MSKTLHNEALHDVTTPHIYYSVNTVFYFTIKCYGEARIFTRPMARTRLDKFWKNQDMVYD